jgi:hypothetical protein
MPSNTILGGPFGLKWPVLQLTRAYWTLIQLSNGVLPPYRMRVNVDIPADLQVVRSDILWLSLRIESSVHLFVSLRQKQFKNMSVGPVPTSARRVSDRPPILAFLVTHLVLSTYSRTDLFLRNPIPTQPVHPPLPPHTMYDLS